MEIPPPVPPPRKKKVKNVGVCSLLSAGGSSVISFRVLRSRAGMKTKEQVEKEGEERSAEIRASRAAGIMLKGATER